MPDLHEWIVQQIDETERIARDAGGKAWQWEQHYGDMCNDPTCEYGELATDDTVLMDVHGYDIRSPRQGAAHIALHNPAAVLRRCAADRKILAAHAPVGGGWPGHYACEGCGYDGGYCPERITDHVNDCPTLLALAEGYGLTEEQRAQLDRPEKERPTPTGPSLFSNEIMNAYSKALTEMVLDARPVEPRLMVKLVGPAPMPMPEWLREDLGLPAPTPEPTPGERAFAVVEPHLSPLALYKPDTDPEA